MILICTIYKGRRGNNMLHCAASKGCLGLVDWLLENVFKETPSVKNDLGETPLHLAAAYFTKGTYTPYSYQLNRF